MKTPLILTALLLSTLSVAAHAATMECSDLAPGHQYFVTIANNKAKVGEKTFAGPRALATLKCVAPAEESPRHPDQGGVALECAEAQQGDGGYRLVVVATGQGPFTAQLSEESIAGPKVLANLVCRYKF